MLDLEVDLLDAVRCRHPQGCLGPADELIKDLDIADDRKRLQRQSDSMDRFGEVRTGVHCKIYQLVNTAFRGKLIQVRR
jgi:hypothetical protein